MAPSNETIDYSLVICVYNPDVRLLRRCLQAVRHLNRNGLTTEVIVADNNSTIPVNSLPFVQEYLGVIEGMKIIVVPEQGVSHARIAAIEASNGKYIVYFDYDNEPEADYLQELKKLHAGYPEVAAWGPGNIWVDFIDGIDKNIEDYARIAFQERHEPETKFSREKEWQACYPFGTGLCTDASLLKEYTSLARQGRFTLSGRKGKQLSSGEDTQMVLLCVSKGYFAGVSPSLKIKHMIPGTRANQSYLLRLAYGTGVCYETCMLQVFTERKNILEEQIMPPAKFSRRTLKKLIQARWSKDPHKMFELVRYVASNAGVYLALNKPLPLFTARIIRYLQLE